MVNTSGKKKRNRVRGVGGSGGQTSTSAATGGVAVAGERGLGGPEKSVLLIGRFGIRSYE